MRRIVTGTDSAGRAVVVTDAELEGDVIDSTLDARRRVVWGADSPPELPSGGSTPVLDGYWPAAGGFRYVIGDVLPDGFVPDANAPASESAAAVAAVSEDSRSGFHTTDTVDVVLVLHGEPALELDDGVVVDLRPGDVVVQNGTRHAWRNRGDRPCRIAVAVFGATRTG